MKNFQSLQATQHSKIINRISLVTLFIVIILTSMLFLPWQQTIKGEGELIAHDPSQRFYTLRATIDGFVEEIYLRENQYIKKGEKLFKMLDLDPNYLERITKVDKSIREQLLLSKKELDTLAKNKQNLLKQIQNAEELYGSRYAQKEDEIESLTLQTLSLEKNYEINKANLERTEQLYKEAIESKRNLERVQNIYIQAKVALENATIELKMKQKDLNIIQKEKNHFLLDTKNRIETLNNQILSTQIRLNTLMQNNELQQSNIARFNSSDIKAEHNGYVLRVLVNDTNRYIHKGEEIVRFAPDVEQRTIIFKVSDFNMPLLKKGLQARIMFYGWPALQISGWPKIETGTFSGIIEKVDPIAHEPGFYYAYVIEDPKHPWPPSDVLRLGTRATVWARLNTVAIWEQIWRKMNAFPPQMLTPQEKK